MMMTTTMMMTTMMTIMMMTTTKNISIGKAKRGAKITKTIATKRVVNMTKRVASMTKRVIKNPLKQNVDESRTTLNDISVAMERRSRRMSLVDRLLSRQIVLDVVGDPSTLCLMSVVEVIE